MSSERNPFEGREKVVRFVALTVKVASCIIRGVLTAVLLLIQLSSLLHAAIVDG